MEIERAVDFVRTNHRAVLQTFRRDGRPAMSPIAVAVDDTSHLVISTRETAMKAKHLTRDPRCSLCVMNDGFFGEWILVEGTAEVVPMPDAMALLEATYRQIAGEHPDWDEFRSAMREERRVALRISIERAGPDQSG
jgi:PPOX class probable F420-dependent enzyme